VGEQSEQEKRTAEALKLLSGIGGVTFPLPKIFRGREATGYFITLLPKIFLDRINRINRIKNGNFISKAPKGRQPKAQLGLWTLPLMKICAISKHRIAHHIEIYLSYPRPTFSISM
jgi:hypothetical protein